MKVQLNPEEGYQAKTVAAVGIGCFAIHKDGINDNNFWKVTHIPTGFLVGWFFSGTFAKNYAKWLMSLSIDWNNIKSRDEAVAAIPVDVRLECARMIHSEPVPRSWKVARSI